MITHVAIKDRDGTVWSLPKPNRHHNVIHLIQEQIGKPGALKLLGNHTQGFVKDNRRFLSRKEAFYEALQYRQLLPPYNPINPSMRAGQVDETPRELFSEDLW